MHDFMWVLLQYIILLQYAFYLEKILFIKVNNLKDFFQHVINKLSRNQLNSKSYFYNKNFFLIPSYIRIILDSYLSVVAYVNW